jgi:hypothetical protein
VRGVPEFETWLAEKGTELSFVITAPEFVEAAAHDLAGIGSTLGEATTINLPLDGILVPAAPYTGSILGLGDVPVFDTPLGGIVPDLLNFVPEELASAIGGPAPFFPPPSSL